MKHPRAKLQLCEATAGAAASAPVDANAPRAVAFRFVEGRQRVSCLTNQVMGGGCEFLGGEAWDRSQLIPQAGLAQRVGAGSISGADLPRPH